MGRRPTLRLAAALLAAMLLGCRDGTSPAPGFVVAGHVRNNTQAPLPPDARLVAIWDVPAGSPDYGYVFGEGTIDRSTGTFRIRFDEPPPAEALNGGALGVGFMIATTDQSLKDGDVITGATLMTGLIGMTGQHAVIFVKSRQEALQVRDWVADFDTGYGVGVGVKVPGDFDKFERTSPSSAVLIVDDRANIEVVNWS